MRFVRLFACVLVVATSGCRGAAALAPTAPGSLAPATSSQKSIWTIDVYVYQYSLAGQQIGQLGGFSDPVGLCTDPSGDLYVVDAGKELIYEYAPGGSLPFYIYDDLGEEPNSCAVDPTTGDLAVTNSGNVLVFPPGSSGTPTAYTASNMSSYAYCNYDASGNLFVDGAQQIKSLRLAELPKGSSSMTAITISNLPKGTHRPGGIQWDGQYVALSDGLANFIYRISVSGSSGKIVSMSHVAGWRLHYNVQFSIQGKRLLFPFPRRLEFFSYPPKGRARGGFTGHIGNRAMIVSPE